MTDRPPVLWIDLNRADRRRRRMSRASSEVVDDTNGDLNDDGTVALTGMLDCQSLEWTRCRDQATEASVLNFSRCCMIIINRQGKASDLRIPQADTRYRCYAWINFQKLDGDTTEIKKRLSAWQ